MPSWLAGCSARAHAARFWRYLLPSCLPASLESGFVTTSDPLLRRDFKRLQNDPPQGVSGAPMDNNIMQWNAVIFGCDGTSSDLLRKSSRCFVVRPDETPWEGGTFKLTLTFTEEYPNKAPAVKFISRMFHPNSTCRFPSGSHRLPLFSTALSAHSLRRRLHLPRYSPESVEPDL